MVFRDPDDMLRKIKEHVPTENIEPDRWVIDLGTCTWPRVSDVDEEGHAPSGPGDRRLHLLTLSSGKAPSASGWDLTALAIKTYLNVQLVRQVRDHAPTENIAPDRWVVDFDTLTWARESDVLGDAGNTRALETGWPADSLTVAVGSDPRSFEWERLGKTIEELAAVKRSSLDVYSRPSSQNQDRSVACWISQGLMARIEALADGAKVSRDAMVERLLAQALTIRDI